jgi:hypothetical protein
MPFQKTYSTNDVRLANAANAVNTFLTHLESEGVGPDLAQKLTIAATPNIIAATLYGYSYGSYANNA